jgi:hypothetical protein
MLGQASLNTELFDVTFATGETTWPLHTNISLNTSTPYLADYMTFASLAPLDVILDKMDNFDIENPTPGEIRNMIINPKNFGLGLDLGVDYRFNKWLQVSASVIDIGRIKWRSGVINLTNQADYSLNGLELLLGGDEDFLKNFTDSLKNTFNQFTSSQTKYSTGLPTKIYAGAALYVHPKVSFGLLSRTDFYKGNVKQHFTASANLYPIRMLSTTFSYSVIDKSYKNLGIGLALKLFPFNFYVISDTGPSAAMWWNEAKYANLRVGFNMMFGCRKIKEKKGAKKVDIPLID